ncbi:unnamed protein product, partial [Laminaria digitata]
GTQPAPPHAHSHSTAAAPSLLPNTRAPSLDDDTRRPQTTEISTPSNIPVGSPLAPTRTSQPTLRDAPRLSARDLRSIRRTARALEPRRPPPSIHVCATPQNFSVQTRATLAVSTDHSGPDLLLENSMTPTGDQLPRSFRDIISHQMADTAATTP